MSNVFPQSPQLSQLDNALVHAYERQGRTLDDLPYTTEFGQIVTAGRQIQASLDELEAFHRLQAIRKAGKLPRIEYEPPVRVHLSENERDLLIHLVTQALGSLGRRDQLPYSAQAEDLRKQFSDRTGRDLSQYEFWRAVARIAK